MPGYAVWEIHPVMKIDVQWYEIVADNLNKAGWSLATFQR
jgi:hypothetical protein